MPTTLDAIETGLALRLRERAAHAFLQAVKIIAGMLAGEQAVVRVEQHALRAGRIVDHAAAEFRAVRTAHDERAHGIGSEIDAEGEH